MTKYFLHKPINSLLLVLIFLTSCNGQTKTPLQTDSVSATTTNSIGRPKIIKTQGTDQNQNVQCGLQDTAGNLWFGTTGEGVYRYDGKSFTNFTTKVGLCSNEILSVLEDKTGNIWFGTRNGACRYDGKTFTNIPITATNGRNFYPSALSNNTSSEKNAVWSMLQDKTGNIWFGTFDSGVYRYDGKTFTHFLDNDGIINKDSVELKWVETILEDKDGNIWLGGRTNKGVFRYDGKSITRFKPDGVEKWMRPLLQDKAGNIWFGIIAGGVIRYDGKTFIHFAEKEISGWVFYMAEDKTGNLWFTNDKDGGVICYNPVLGVFKHFTMKDCQVNYPVWSIVEDRDGNLWLGTKNIGLCRYDGKTFTNFSE